MRESSNIQDGRADFDFLAGQWKVHQPAPARAAQGLDRVDQFEASNVARLLLGGLGNEDEFRTSYGGDFHRRCRFDSSTQPRGSGRSTGSTTASASSSRQ